MEMAVATAAKVQNGVIDFWYTYRVPFLVSLCAIAVFVKIFARQRFGRGRTFHNDYGKPTSTGIGPVEQKRALESVEQSVEKVQSKQNEAGTIQKNRREPKKVSGQVVRRGSPQNSKEPQSFKIQPFIFFASLTGSTEVRARTVAERLKESRSKHDRLLEPELHDISYIDYDDYFVSLPKVTTGTKPFYLIIVPTYNIDTALDAFREHLSETHHDFRIDTAPLSGLAGFSVFGFGDREGWPSENEGFCSQAKDVDRWMAKLTNRKRAFPLGLGDVKSDAENRLDEWLSGVVDSMTSIANEGFLGEGVPGSGDAVESDEEEVDEPTSNKITRNKQLGRRKAIKAKRPTLGDMEDLGSQASLEVLNSPLPLDFTTSGRNQAVLAPEIKQMVPKASPTYAALTKQGYTIIGSHSGVKICRWTKSALRGRGSCYKHSFYGIASHLCMETTPSLSCSNKCVFCWRHGTNPVGTTWRWQVDPPEMIFKGAVEGHLKKIKMMRGVPGVRAERFQEAMRIRHCALSLVGEPIFYPHINEFVSLLHQNRISSFLVCNAQHPKQLANLRKVTQLYVSIDASNKEALRKVDRPLHRDFWERFCKCLDILSTRRNTMRTVFRLTLVKGFNLDEEAEGYADLVAKGRPCFVEIKGVTYCGTSTSTAAGLTMQNVPFWEEVQAFVLALHKALLRRGLDYGMAAEHAHSCCALLAEDRFKRDGRWCTIIDYERFFNLLESGEEFGPQDYMGEPTPEWALWGCGGFDPSDERVDRKGRKIEV